MDFVDARMYSVSAGVDCKAAGLICCLAAGINYLMVAGVDLFSALSFCVGTIETFFFTKS